MKALFLDKDGTLVDSTGFPQVIPTDKVWLERTADGLRLLQERYALFIVSNQGWISTGRMSIEEAGDAFTSVLEQYRAVGVHFAGYEFCPHGKMDDCLCRKPRTGMLDAIAARHPIDRDQSYFVGDLETDVLVGKAFGIQTAIVETERSYRGTTQPDIIVPDVNALAAILLK